MNFMSGTPLAILQDNYIQAYTASQSIPDKKAIRFLENDLWIEIAYNFAPNNLVIRQYCLIDVFNNRIEHKERILNLLNLLSYKNFRSLENRIWAEGYSYWVYVRSALDLWVKKFQDPEAIEIIRLIEEGFLQTSYKRNGIWYPAPFGDLRDTPLSNQKDHNMQSCTIGTVSLFVGDPVRYSIKGRPIGCNTHISKDDYNLLIVDGVPQGFHFYEGYDKKYKSRWDEIKDTLDPKRIFSKG